MNSFDVLVMRVWHFFKSLKLAIALLTLILGSSIIGTLVVQTSQSETPLDAIYPQSLIGIFSLLGMFDLYHSWWFILLLFLFFINLLICTLDKIPKFFKLYKADIPQPNQAKDIPKNFYLKKITLKNIQKAEHLLKENLSDFRLTQSSPQETIFEKTSGCLSSFNVVIVHTGILLIMIGALISAIFGYNGRMSLKELDTSNTVTIPQTEDKVLFLPLPFSVKLEKFKIEYYNNETKDRPKQYSSFLEIIKRGQTLFKTQIEVNKPLSYEGINLYQSSFTEDTKLEFELHNLKTGERTQNVFGIGEKGGFANTSISIMPVEYTPDFQMDKHDKNLGPAVLVHSIGAGNMGAPFWVLKNYPEFSSLLDSNFQLILKDTHSSFGSVLEVSKNPGAEVILLGAILLTIGLLLVAFFKFSKYWIVFNHTEQEVTLILYSKHLPSSAQFYLDKTANLLKRKAL